MLAQNSHLPYKHNPQPYLLHLMGQKEIEREIVHRRWGLIGHTLRKSKAKIIRQALDQNPQGKIRSGRPKQTWITTISEKIQHGQTSKGLSYRIRWRAVLEALCSTQDKNYLIYQLKKLLFPGTFSMRRLLMYSLQNVTNI